MAIDLVAEYAERARIEIGPKTVIVEGRSDVDLLSLAANLEAQYSGNVMFSEGFVVSACGGGNEGGARGVIDELTTLWGISRRELKSNGRPKYRIVGLLDNDDAGRRAIHGAKQTNRMVKEFRELFRLHPIMPSSGNLDAKSLARSFDKFNQEFSGLDWEIEDAISDDFVEIFLEEHPEVAARTQCVGNKIHRDFSWDGKAKLKKFTEEYAAREDLLGIIEILNSLRFIMGMKTFALTDFCKRTD